MAVSLSLTLSCNLPCDSLHHSLAHSLTFGVFYDYLPRGSLALGVYSTLKICTCCGSVSLLDLCYSLLSRLGFPTMSSGHRDEPYQNMEVGWSYYSFENALITLLDGVAMIYE